MLIAWQFGPTWKGVLAFVCLGVVILVGSWSILSMRREDREDQEGPVTDAEILAQFEEARAFGELDEEEYQRVRAVVTGRAGLPSSGGTEERPDSKHVPGNEDPLDEEDEA